MTSSTRNFPASAWNGRYRRLFALAGIVAPYAGRQSPREQHYDDDSRTSPTREKDIHWPEGFDLFAS